MIRYFDHTDLLCWQLPARTFDGSPAAPNPALRRPRQRPADADFKHPKSRPVCELDKRSLMSLENAGKNRPNDA